MGCVPRGPGASHSADLLPVLDRVQVLLRNRQHLPEQLLQALAEHPPRARHQPRRVGEVPRPEGMDVYRQLWPAGDQRAGGPRVVEVDVGQQQRPRPIVPEPVEQAGKAGARAAVDEHVPAQPRPHRARAAVVTQVDDARVHLVGRGGGRSTLATGVLQRVWELS